MVQIILIETKSVKNPNTKTTYIIESKETKTITEKQYLNIVSDDTCKFFRRLGGSETKTMGYTCNGYKCTKLVSISPDKQNKTIREFQFNWIDTQNN